MMIAENKRPMKKKRFCLRLLSMIAVLFLLPVRTVSADMGPKPSVDVQVINPPDEPYTLDFLVKQEKEADDTQQSDSEQSELYEFDDGKWRMRERNDDGMGDGSLPSNDAHQYHFFYMCPDEFRLIIVTESGKVITTNKLNPLLYNTTVTFDAAAGTLTEDAAAKCSGLLRAAKYILEMFGITCFCTIIIEQIIMLLFFLKMNKHDWRLFALTQFCTQVLLYAVLFFIPWANLYLFTELVILVAEALIYYKYMETPHKIRAAVAGIVANAASAAVGLMPFVWVVCRAMRGLP